ncbi:MAG: hypothetical protein KAQ72_02885 [Desulfobacula sp.]|nr:hypothetical protein [Desulfobacula sp.]
MIEQSRIDHIKTSVDLKAYIEQAAGSAFKKNGKGYVCRCPFQDGNGRLSRIGLQPAGKEDRAVRPPAQIDQSDR